MMRRATKTIEQMLKPTSYEGISAVNKNASFIGLLPDLANPLLILVNAYVVATSVNGRYSHAVLTSKTLGIWDLDLYYTSKQ
jgi:hypothetical protein